MSMEYRQLGQTDVRISAIGLGCFHLGAKADRAATKDIVGRCLDLGVTFFDTANSYNEGRSEEFLADSLGTRRRDVIIATKVGRVFYGPRGKMARDSSPAEIQTAVEASLGRLKTDYIDLYQIHWPDPDTPIEDTMAALAGLLRAGKIRSVGVCNFSVDQIRTAMTVIPQLAALQSPYSMLRRELEHDAFPFCVQRGIGIIPYRPLQQGLLTERSATMPLRPATDAKRRADSQLAGRIANYARELGRPVAHIALAWLLAKPGVTSVIPGVSDPSQVQASIGLDSWELSGEEIRELDRLLAGGSDHVH